MPDINDKTARGQEAQLIIDRLNGPAATARLLGIEAPSVCAWRKNGIARGWIKWFNDHRPEILEGTRWEGGAYPDPRRKVATEPQEA